MEKIVKEIIDILLENNETISSMESCTGGLLASTITNIPGSSDVFSFGAVTYGTEYKIKMGVKKNTINKFTVYSKEVAKEMSKAISKFASSTYGIGITGKLNVVAYPNKEVDNTVYISIYDSKADAFYTYSLNVYGDERKTKKEFVVNKVLQEILPIIKDFRN